ncbi:hypothetical protein DWW90_16125 [Parabacteroides sp. AF17-28]|nr:hypothetical protein DWW90_16125 [Parabacteroides sp. AF17-28]
MNGRAERRKTVVNKWFKAKRGIESEANGNHIKSQMKPELCYHPVTFIPVRWMIDNMLINKGRMEFTLANAGVFLKR